MYTEGEEEGAKREAIEKEDTSLALTMGRWLAKFPPMIEGKSLLDDRTLGVSGLNL